MSRELTWPEKCQQCGELATELVKGVELCLECATKERKKKVQRDCLVIKGVKMIMP